MLKINYGLWVGAWCVVGTLVGMQLIERLMKKWDRQSPLVILLAFILGIRAFAVLYFGVAKADFSSDQLW